MTASSYYSLFAAFAMAAVLAFLLTPPVKDLAGRIGAIDVPKDMRRMHKHPIPRLGGLAIFLSFLFTTLLFCPMTAALRGTLLGAVVIVVMGVVDDVVALPAKPKFVVQILAALIPISCGVRVDVVTNFNIFSSRPYMSLGIFSIPLTLLWIVGMTNAVNFIDGLDGLAVGVSSIGTFSILVIAVLVSEGDIALLAAILCGACLGFFPYNRNPAKIFMGDTGATFLGYILATLSVQGLFKMYAVISFFIPFLIFGLPIFDTAFAIFRRVLSGHSPMEADRGHLHHRLIDMGFSQQQAVAILYVVSALLGLSAVLLTTTTLSKALLGIGCALILAASAFKILNHHRAALPHPHQSGSESKEKRL